MMHGASVFARFKDSPPMRQAALEHLATPTPFPTSYFRARASGSRAAGTCDHPPYALPELCNDLRGTLRNFGLKVGMVGKVKFEGRIKELVENLPDLAVLVEPMLIVRRTLREQIVILHRRLLAIVVVDSLKALDPEWPIREADVTEQCHHFRLVPRGDISLREYYALDDLFGLIPSLRMRLRRSVAMPYCLFPCSRRTLSLWAVAHLER
jgi:hypothetical protein